MAKVLVVDDEESIRRALGKRLVKLGYEAVVAGDGVEAWERIQQESFDLIISDYKMPRMDGLELLRRVRQSETAPPVIMITGTSTEDPQIFMDRGARAYLLKPISREDLEAALQNILRAPGV